MSVSKDPVKKTWTVQVWYKDYTGARKHTTKRGFATKREAERWEHEFSIAEHSNDITIGELARAFKNHLDLQVTLGSIRQTTAKNKKQIIDSNIIPKFEKTLAKKLTTAQVNKWLCELVKSKPIYKKCDRLSSGYINIIKSSLSQCYKYGIAELGLKENPVEGAATLTYYSNDDRETWNKEQFLMFRGSLYHEDIRLIFDIIFLTGLRIGETISLTPNDIHEGYIEIVKTAISKTDVNKPKTKSSARKVAISSGLYQALVDYMKTIPYLTPTDRIFSRSRDSVAAAMKTTIKRLNLPKISPHILRHIYASNLYQASGHNITVVTKQLGHANPKVTLEVYTDMTEGEDVKAVEILDTIYAKKVKLNSN